MVSEVDTRLVFVMVVVPVGVFDIDTEPVTVRVAVVVLDKAIVPVSVGVPWTVLVTLTL